MEGVSKAGRMLLILILNFKIMIINTVTESNTNPTRNNVLAKVDNLKKKNFY